MAGMCFRKIPVQILLLKFAMNLAVGEPLCGAHAKGSNNSGPTYPETPITGAVCHPDTTIRSFPDMFTFFIPVRFGPHYSCIQ